MRKTITTWILAILLSFSFTLAETAPVSAARHHAASNRQIAWAYQQCQRKFGYRFVRAKIRGNHYICQFRDSNATIAKKALKRCAHMGASFRRVTKIRIKGNRYIAHFECERGGRGA